MTPDTVSLPEAARRLGISPRSAQRLAKRDGQLCEGVPVLRFGSSLRVSVHQLDKLLGVEERRAS